MIPQYNNVILPVPWYILISGFHCSKYLHTVLLNTLKEVDVAGKKAVVISVPVPEIRAFQKIQVFLTFDFRCSCYWKPPLLEQVAIKLIKMLL